MKKHAIIPIFIPHRGCPNDCVFCNQKKITARQDDINPETARQTIETWLTTLGGVETVEIAFFGGSFTGIPMEEQSAFLAIAKEYKDAGRVHQIHLSTRPDYITEEILENLKAYGVDVIELGVQSLDDDVLRSAGRGHNAAAVYRAAQLIKDFGFTLGIQLMVGLPGSSLESEIFSAEETVRIGPKIARLYPTVILPETELYDMYRCGQYMPMAEEEAVHRTKAMYKILHAAGINIIRVGLKSSGIMTDGTEGGAANTFHPAFRQLVEGQLAREELEGQLVQLTKETRCIQFVSTEKDRNSLFGHKGANREYFAKKYPELNIQYLTDKQAGIVLAEGEYRIIHQIPRL